MKTPTHFNRTVCDLHTYTGLIGNTLQKEKVESETTPSREQHKQALISVKKEVRPHCTLKQEEECIRDSSLRNRHLTDPQLAASLRSTQNVSVNICSE